MSGRRLVALIALCVSVAAGAQDVVTPAMLTASLERAVAAGTPGMSAAIATRRGVVWTGVAGAQDVRSGKPIDGANIFGIGSITKVFVAVTVLQLIEEGRLSLDDTPARVLGKRVVDGIANADTATVAQLLGHRSGIASWEDDPAWIRKGRGAGLDPTHQWGKTEALAYNKGHPALFAPGSAFSYSNSGYTILGLMIEKVSGHTAEAEIRRRVLLPLCLNDTYFEGFEPGQDDRLPRRYHHATPKFRAVAGIAPSFVTIRPDLVDVGPTDLSVEWTAGAMVSSPRDLVMFGRALRDGKLLKPRSMAFMQAWAPAFPSMKAGHGLFEIRTDAGPAIGHTGGVLGFSASLWWLESGDAVVAVLANLGTVHAGKPLPDGPHSAPTVASRSDFGKRAVQYAAQTEVNEVKSVLQNVK